MSRKPERGAVAIIPVRVGSQRLPGKALLSESGKELFLHTADAARRASNIDRVYVATDDERVEAAAVRHGYAVARTSKTCRTGSERCAEAAAAIPCQVVLDIQGDWPEVLAQDLEAMVNQLLLRKAVCNTMCVPLRDAAIAQNPNVVKVVRGRSGKALYFSRAVIPHTVIPHTVTPQAGTPQAGTPQTGMPHPGIPDRREGAFPLLRHIGVYGFLRETLLSVPGLPSSGLAEAEGLEQLRFLENDIAMHVLDATGDPWGIETRSDYDAFLQRVTASRTPR